MKTGDVVTVYHDPLLETDPEGEAELIKCITDDFEHYGGRPLERWIVGFKDGTLTYHYQRSILAKEK